MKKLTTVFLWMALFVGNSVLAGEFSIAPPYGSTEPVERLTPHQGGWWNPAQSGSGYFIEFSQNADGSLLGFATTYTYDAEGKSTFLIVQAPVVFSTNEERLATGIIARFSSPLFKAENGQQFGGTYRPATVSPSTFGNGEYVFFTRRTGEFRAGGRTTPIRALSPLPSEAEYTRLLTGTWKLQGNMRRNPESNLDPAFVRTVSHIVRLQPSQVQPTWSAGPAVNFIPATLAKFWQPTANVITFDVVCETDCPPVPHPLGDPYQKFAATFAARIWVDVATGRAGYVTGAMNFGADNSTAYWATNESTSSQVAGGTSWTFDLFIDDATLVGRGGVIVTHPFWVQGFHFGSEIVMTKIDPKTGLRGTKIY